MTGRRIGDVIGQSLSAADASHLQQGDTPSRTRVLLPDQQPIRQNPHRASGNQIQGASGRQEGRRSVSVNGHFDGRSCTRWGYRNVKRGSACMIGSKGLARKLHLCVPATRNLDSRRWTDHRQHSLIAIILRCSFNLSKTMVHFRTGSHNSSSVSCFCLVSPQTLLLFQGQPLRLQGLRGLHRPSVPATGKDGKPHAPC